MARLSMVFKRMAISWFDVCILFIENSVDYEVLFCSGKGYIHKG